MRAASGPSSLMPCTQWKSGYSGFGWSWTEIELSWTYAPVARAVGAVHVDAARLAGELVLEHLDVGLVDPDHVGVGDEGLRALDHVVVDEGRAVRLEALELDAPLRAREDLVVVDAHGLEVVGHVHRGDAGEVTARHDLRVAAQRVVVDLDLARRALDDFDAVAVGAADDELEVVEADVVAAAEGDRGARLAVAGALDDLAVADGDLAGAVEVLAADAGRGAAGRAVGHRAAAEVEDDVAAGDHERGARRRTRPA